ncbi:unnamed protein product [Ectocarpus sp. 4 AP-2014]
MPLWFLAEGFRRSLSEELYVVPSCSTSARSLSELSVRTQPALGQPILLSTLRATIAFALPLPLSATSAVHALLFREYPSHHALSCLVGDRSSHLSLQQVSSSVITHVLDARMLCFCFRARLWEQEENVREDILKLGRGANAVEIDLMEPLDPTKPPRVQTPALNHIGLWVHPLPECVEWLTRQGMHFTPGGIRQGASGHDVAFIHPKGDVNNPLSGEGVLIELVQAPPDIVANAERK